MGFKILLLANLADSPFWVNMRIMAWSFAAAKTSRLAKLKNYLCKMVHRFRLH